MKVTFLTIASAILHIDPESQEGLSILIAATGNSEDFIRTSAIFALGDLDVIADDVVPILIQLLDSDDSANRYYAVTALGRIGPAASDALPKLRELVKNDPSWDEMTKEYDIRVNAREAIDKIEGME